MAKTKITITLIIATVLILLSAVITATIIDHNRLSENEARVALNECLTNWSFGSLEDTDNISVIFEPSAGYQPDKFKILGAHSNEANIWELKAEIYFQAKRGYSKPYILEFTTFIGNDGKVAVVCYQDPGSVDFVDTLQKVVK